MESAAGVRGKRARIPDEPENVSAWTSCIRAMEKIMILAPPKACLVQR